MFYSQQHQLALSRKIKSTAVEKEKKNKKQQKKKGLGYHLAAKPVLANSIFQINLPAEWCAICICIVF